jgi:hypothetical protein
MRAELWLTAAFCEQKPAKPHWFLISSNTFLEFEKVGAAFACALFVPGHDGLLAEADVASVEAYAVLGERASPDFFHGFDPAAGSHAVAFAPFHVEAEACAADEAVQGKGFEDVGHGGGVGAGARQRVAYRKLGDDSATFEKVISRHQSSIGGERLVAAAQVKLATCGKEFEIKCCLTQWVKWLFVRFRLQMPIG